MGFDCRKCEKYKVCSNMDRARNMPCINFKKMKKEGKKDAIKNE